MTSSTARSPRLPLIATLVLAVAGVILLMMPPAPSAPATTATPRVTPPTPVPSSAIAGQGSPNGAPPSATDPTPVETASASALPPHGEGVAADGAIQKSLEDAWPADLSADDEHKLLADGRGLLRADATGIGRTKWPALFGDPDQAIAPAFATARYRIQAAIARSDGSLDKAVVHLVWAGTDRGGTYTDRRITDLFFTRTVKKGEPTWTPQPRI